MLNRLTVSVTSPVRGTRFAQYLAGAARPLIGRELARQVYPRRSASCAYTATSVNVSSMPESVVQDLQPQALWNYFYALTQLPRPSKSEEKYVSLHTPWLAP